MYLKSDDLAKIKILGQNIRRIRTDRKLTMQQLANQADIELSQIYRIETAKINPKFITVLNIAKALEIDPKDLF
jgi:transcriptional regulator with XRE-family HTH domain